MILGFGSKQCYIIYKLKHSVDGNKYWVAAKTVSINITCVQCINKGIVLKSNNLFWLWSLGRNGEYVSLPCVLIPAIWLKSDLHYRPIFYTMYCMWIWQHWIRVHVPVTHRLKYPERSCQYSATEIATQNLKELKNGQKSILLFFFF